jgi:hypothetical protein
MRSGGLAAFRRVKHELTGVLHAATRANLPEGHHPLVPTRSGGCRVPARDAGLGGWTWPPAMCCRW